MIDWKNFFKPEDFNSLDDAPSDWTSEKAAEIANAKLWAAIQCERKVYGDMHDGGYHGKPTSWSSIDSSCDTHSAIVTNIEKLGK